MNSKAFIQMATDLVIDYYNQNADITDRCPVSKENVFVVWSCYILGNIKAMLSTNIPDGMYYEITYNEVKHEVYFDAYKKWENHSYKVEDADGTTD